jgi:hypothetical protein
MTMADDATNGPGGGTMPKASQGYEVKVFAAKYRLTPDQARQLIAEVGNDRTRLHEAASMLRKR